MEFGTPATIVCCLCGAPIQSNPSNMCVSCISTQIDVTEEIQKEATVLHCPGCESYFQPPKHWVKASLESRELLAYCLKRIRGLQKVKLVDAEFVWTEPHSKRIRIQLTVQKEFNGAIVQGSCVVVFVVQNNLCSECNKRNTNKEYWSAVVQVRQHVPHKRTFFFLEQLILKHKVHENTTNMKSLHEGVDFYYSSRPHAQKFVDFLHAVVPIRYRNDRSLVSHDTKSNNFNYKYTFSVEIVPICKEDLVCLPPKANVHYGGIGSLVVCSKVSSSLQFVDPLTTKSFYMDAGTYWRYSFKPLRSSRQLVKFVVLDIEPLGQSQGKFALAEATVARESDFGVSDQSYSVNTFLGNILKPGDMALGYDLANAILVNWDLDGYVNKGYTVPDVILVKKSYDETRKRRQKKGKNRRWKIDHLKMEIDETTTMTKKTEFKEEEDRELFLQEIEEDPELRAQVPLMSAERSDNLDEITSDMLEDSEDEEMEDLS